MQAGKRIQKGLYKQLKLIIIKKIKPKYLHSLLDSAKNKCYHIIVKIIGGYIMAENFKFKTETKRLLDMMINSIYTHKEIFLR